MKAKKKQQLEAHGWHVGAVDEFLGLSAAEAAYIELKLALSAQRKQRRQQQKLTRVELAKRLQSNQSRVAKMEAGIHQSLWTC
jgi:Helix-turn-helix